mgnify:CR=1 FL=1
MNLFDMIFRNALAKEVVFSSVYNYLLEKSETHGMGSLVFDHLLDAIADQDLVTEIRDVFTEWNEVQPEYELGPKIGRVDSMLNLGSASGDRSLWLLTEVKIVDASAKNSTVEGSQLDRYVRAAIEAKGQDFVLLYMIPSTASTYAIREFEQLLKGLDESHRRRCFVLFWKSSPKAEISLPEGSVLRKSFEEILQEVLTDEAVGKIAPISTEIRYVLKSIIQSVRQDFNRTIDVYEPGRFPDRTTFLANLPDVHHELFAYLESILGGRRKVSTGNTSVGFPYTDRPARGSYNTLFRVLTMTKYGKTSGDISHNDYADRLIIECDEQVYPDQEFWQAVSNDLNGTAAVKHGQRHPDASGSRHAIWIEFDPKLLRAQIDSVKAQLDALVEGLRGEFAKWSQTNP